MGEERCRRVTAWTTDEIDNMREYYESGVTLQDFMREFPEINNRPYLIKLRDHHNFNDSIRRKNLSAKKNGQKTEQEQLKELEIKVTGEGKELSANEPKDRKALITHGSVRTKISDVSTNRAMQIINSISDLDIQDASLTEKTRSAEMLLKMSNLTAGRPTDNIAIGVIGLDSIMQGAYKDRMRERFGDDII